MDFRRVLGLLADQLERESARWAVVGAFGLQAHGIVRATLDLDIVVADGARRELVRYLEGLGYETLHASEGYSNHLHPDPALGRVDVIYVGGDTAGRLFDGCQPRPGPGGRTVPVPRPEHLAAMKVHAMRQDPTRMLQDLADVQELLGLPGVDEAEIRGYFERAGLGERFDAIRRR